MSRIIEISDEHGRVTFELDDGEKYAVAKEFAKALLFAEGDELTEDDIGAIKSASEKSRAVAKALDALSYSSVSRKALVDKLRLKYKVPREAAEDAADYAVSRRYLDEGAQAAKYAATCCRTKMWGRARIERELAAKGYPKDVCAEAAQSVPEEDYREACRRLVDKKIASAPEDRREYDRVISSLIRLGHSPKEIKAALSAKFNDM